MTPDPQTAADAAAEHVAAFCNALDHYGDDGNPIASEHNPDGDSGTVLYLTLTKPDLRALLADRTRMAAELEQVRAAKAANLSDYEAALLAVHEARDYWQAQAVAEWECAEKLRTAMLEAAGLLARLAGPGACDYDGGVCHRHGYLEPCPHPLARQFVKTWQTDAVKTAATRPADGLDSTGESQRTREVPQGAQQDVGEEEGGR